MTRIALAALLAIVTAACGDDDGDDGYQDDGSYDCASDDRADDFAVGLTRPGDKGTLTFRLMTSTPAPPSRGDNTWTLEVVDAAQAPVVGATVTVVPFMPDHRHGTGIKAVVSDQGGGGYQATLINLWMPGLWEITVTATVADGGSDRAVFRFCIAS